MANQASMVRRQRERARQQKRREKQARKAERREQKKVTAGETEAIVVEDPHDDPSIDWGSAVRETEVVLNENFEVVEDEPEEEADSESEEAQVAAESA